MAKAPKNFELKNFRNRVFGSNHVLNHCKSILKYIFSENSQNFHILTIFLKLWQNPREKFSSGTVFRNRVFRFKARFKQFWIDSETQPFSKSSFLVSLGSFLKSLGRKMKKTIYCAFRECYHGYFKLPIRTLAITIRPESHNEQTCTATSLTSITTCIVWVVTPKLRKCLDDFLIFWPISSDHFDTYRIYQIWMTTCNTIPD